MPTWSYTSREFFTPAWSYTSREMLASAWLYTSCEMLTLHGDTQAANTCSYIEKFNIYLASEQDDEHFICSI